MAGLPNGAVGARVVARTTSASGNRKRTAAGLWRDPDIDATRAREARKMIVAETADGAPARRPDLD
jgi:hypothetical protein